ncbi:MAG: HEPN domain-containing protein [Cyanobacteria bacterium Co-bin13]|nr:HEPN domain-containing protein [Cyanobacteria bacterium Co-bin13]
MTPEQQALLDKARRSLEAAQKLMQQEFYDFAVSRAYYAMFYVAEALLNHEGLAFSSHGAVIGAFGQHFAKPGKVPAEFHRYLIDAQAQRTQADYDAQPDISQEDAETLVSQAQAFITIGFGYLKTR